MPTRTIGKKMMVIDAEAVKNDIRSHGYSVWGMARLLLPHYAEKHDSYCMFKAWMKKGRMPKEKYEQMRRILDGID